MPGITTKTVPYNVSGDGANSIGTEMQALAQWLDDSLNSFTTTERDALSPALKWPDRLIWNKTTHRQERWDSTSTSWKPVSSNRRRSFLLASS